MSTAMVLDWTTIEPPLSPAVSLPSSEPDDETHPDRAADGFVIKTDSAASADSDASEDRPGTIAELAFRVPTRARHFLGWRAAVLETAADPAPETSDFAELAVPGADPGDDVLPFVVESTDEQVAEARRFFRDAKGAESKAQKSRARTQSRVFSVMQYRKNPDSGVVMLTQEQIDQGIKTLGGRLHKWAYIWHPYDRLVEVEESTGEVTCCGVKGLHAHMVLWIADSDGPRPSIRTISDAFAIPSAVVRTPKETTADDPASVEHKGRGAAEKAFYDLCEYLPHESRGSDAIPGIHQQDRHYLVDKTQPGKPGKYQYGRGRVVANFAFGRELDAHMATRHNAATDGGSGAKLSKLYQAVGSGSLTLRQVREREPAIYFAKGTIAHLQKCRDDYLLRAPLPPFRTNYYIGGPARTGKSTVAVLYAETLARQLYPGLALDEAIYMVGRPGVAFQSYDGQPILIWDDYRPLSIIEAIGGDVRQRDSIWPVLDIDPKRVQVNKKFGAVSLLNSVNIITGIQSYVEFLDGLAGEYTDKKTGERVEVEDKDQAYGRVPLVAAVTSETIDFYLNRGFAGRSDSYQDFDPVARIRANMGRVIDTIDALPTEAAKEQFREAAGARMLGGMVQAHLDLKPTPAALTAAEALAELEATTTVEGPEELAAEALANDSATAAEAMVAADERSAQERYACADGPAWSRNPFVPEAQPEMARYRTERLLSHPALTNTINT
ncbi:hypothetical protein SAMN04488550_2922 [Gordonia malaquae]|uniref:Uncharacterized protein n=1 Tax=Gordonia malaquae NBRC 108250 TaxID=1223542 RepID=M3VDX3_GORML|nr:hypothetical protein [Gordonia malaquae]GAC78794.1 hypothetical protein GM1_004_02390 [Gordonia malaquae NBRC 108250]SED66507.1 hypothetical protein SAMN04488550_2922 [Gordonia malaquae]